jgi:hypothetical protein
MKSGMQIVIFAGVAVVAGSIGFLMGSDPAAEETSAIGNGDSAQSAKTASNERAGSGEKHDDQTPAERRGRILQSLLATMQQPDAVRKIRGDYYDEENLGPEDIQAALELVLKQNDDAQGTLVPQIVARWAEFDPKAAAEYAVGLTEDGRRWSKDRLIACVTNMWADKEPAAAKAWAFALPKGAKQKAAISGLAGSMMQSDPGATLAWAKSLPAEMRPDDLHRRIFFHWIARDPATASQMALSLPSGEDRQDTLSAVASSLASRDLQAAFDMLEQVPESGTRNMEIANTIAKWSAKDPDAAMAAAHGMPAGGMRTNAYSGILAMAAQKGEAEVARLLAQIPEGPERNEAEKMAKEAARR